MEMLRYIFRTRYRIVHDTVGRKYTVESRPWWWPLWGDVTAYWHRFETEEEAARHIVYLKAIHRSRRFRVIYKE